MQVPAAGALCSLVDDCQQNIDAIIAAGAVPTLVALLRSNELDVQVPAADALCSFAEGCQQDIDAIIAAGAVPLLVA